MNQKLDLVSIYINRSKHNLSKWLLISFNDFILLSGYNLDKPYTVSFRYEETDEYTEFLPLEKHTLMLSHDMEVLVVPKEV